MGIEAPTFNFVFAPFMNYNKKGKIHLLELHLLRSHPDCGGLGELEILEGELLVVEYGCTECLTLALAHEGGSHRAEALPQQVPALLTGRAT